MTANSLAMWLTLAAADAVGQHDRDALQAEQRLSRNQDAVKILIGLLAALVGILPDRYFQFTRHLYAVEARGLVLEGEAHHADQDQAATRSTQSRFGAVCTCVA